MSLIPGDRLSRYRLEEPIGRGGMGEVWRAADDSLGRKVAIKVLPQDFAADEAKVARFRREARLLASLNHPSIATIHEISEQDGLHFIAMELVEGQTLRRVLKKGPMGAGEALSIGAGIAEALAFAHEAHVIHRDLKPENVIIRPDGHPKVLDFGLARHLAGEGTGLLDGAAPGRSSDDRLTEAGWVVGTAPYMSPEQARGEELDHRSDIFAFGTLLHEMLSGRMPFHRPSRAETLVAILEREAPPLAAVPGLPPEVAAVVERCLRKDPSQRFATTGELARELRRLQRDLESQPTVAAPAASPAAPSPSGSRATVSGPPEEDPGGRPGGERHQAAAPGGGSGGRRPRPPHHTLVIVLVAVALAAGFFLLTNHLNQPPDEETAAPGITEGDSSGTAAGGGTGIQPGRRIVVLPFENLGDAEDEHFAAGMADEITARLAGVSGLHVIAASSAAGYAGRRVPVETIRQELGVDYVLEGKIRWASSDDTGRIRVTPKLVDARDGSVLWAGILNESTEDVFSVQSGIATTVIEHMGVVLGEGERETVEAVPTGSIEAYEAYLTGRYFAARTDYSEVGRRRVVEAFQAATNLDPGFAQAWAELSRAHAFMFHMGYDRSERRRQLALAAARKAQEIAPGLPEGHVAMGYYSYHVLRDYAAALEEFQKAREGLPGSVDVLEASAYVERRRGNFTESIDLMTEASSLSPRAPGLLSQLGQTLVYAGRHQEAESILKKAIRLDPATSYPFLMLARLEWKRGDLAAAREALDSLPQPLDDPSIYHLYFQSLMEGDPAGALALAGAGAPEVIEWGLFFYPRDLLAGIAHRLRGEEGRARPLLARALDRLREEAAARPDDARVLLGLGLAAALNGLKEEALLQASKGAGIFPTSEDAYSGPHFQLELAWALAEAGEEEQALENLREALEAPGDLPGGVLSVDPRWLSLHGLAGFDALLSEVAGRSS